MSLNTELDAEMAEQIVKLNEELKALQKEKELDNIFWKQECDSLQETLQEKELDIVKINEEKEVLKEALESSCKKLKIIVDNFASVFDISSDYCCSNYFIEQAKESLK